MSCTDCAEKDLQVVYHFMSLQGFERFIKNGYIALSDIIKSNDPAEGFFAFEALKDAYESLYRENIINQQTYMKLHRSYFDFSGGETAFGRFQQVVMSISFCEPELPLALWRAYGDNGRGISFGVSKKQLEEIGKLDNFTFGKIEYLSKDDMRKKAEQFWKNNLNKNEDEIQEALADFYIKGYFIKRIENQYEREWRLIFTGIHLDEYSIIPRDVPDEVDTYMKNDDIVLFYKLSIKERRLLQVIYLGPQCKITLNEMKLFLAKNGIEHVGVCTDGTVMR